jgi:hypothetical protein
MSETAVPSDETKGCTPSFRRGDPIVFTTKKSQRIKSRKLGRDAPKRAALLRYGEPDAAPPGCGEPRRWRAAARPPGRRQHLYGSSLRSAALRPPGAARAARLRRLARAHRERRRMLAQRRRGPGARRPAAPGSPANLATPRAARRAVRRRIRRAAAAAHGAGFGAVLAAGDGVAPQRRYRRQRRDGACFRCLSPAARRTRAALPRACATRRQAARRSARAAAWPHRGAVARGATSPLLAGL